jgi:hypothetical protein
MRRFWIVLATMSIVAAGVSAPSALSVSASGHSDAAAAQKKCKKGFHRVHGKCKKKRPVAPTLAPVPTAIPALLDHPDELAVDAQGNIFVTEGFQGAHSRVLKLSPSGQLLATFGTDGSDPGQFNSPLGVALDAQGNLYVADFFNDRVQKLSPTGQVLTTWGSTGVGAGQVQRTTGRGTRRTGQRLRDRCRQCGRLIHGLSHSEVLSRWSRTFQLGKRRNWPWAVQESKRHRSRCARQRLRH